MSGFPRAAGYCLLLAFGLVVSLLLVVGSGPPLAHAQDKGKEEEEEKPPAKGEPKKKPEPEAPEKEVRPSGFSTELPSEILQKEERDTRYKEVRELMKSVMVPHDILVLKGSQPNIVVLKDPEVVGELDYERWDAGFKNKTALKAKKGEVVGFKPYEELLLERAEAFLAKEVSEVPKDARFSAAVRIVGVGLTFHQSARKAGKRAGAGWDPYEAKLRKKLQDLLRENLKYLADNSRFREASEVALDIEIRYPDEPELQKELARYRLLRADEAFKSGNPADLGSLRQAILRYEQENGGKADGVTQGVRQRLRAEATRLVQRAGAAAEQKLFAEAQRDLRLAEEIDPDYELGKELRRRLRDRVLYVAVKKLPERMTPGTARTDSERWAVELMFESLLQVLPDEDLGVRVVPQLAAGLPSMLTSGRDFNLRRDVRWADGSKAVLDGIDVRKSLEYYRSRLKYPLMGEFGEMLKGSGAIDNPFKIQLGFRQGVTNPLSRFTFRVMPMQQIERMGLATGADDDAFTRRKPFGSGPYRFDRREKDGPREYAVFVVNEFYTQRKDKFGLPSIREIRFFVPEPVTVVGDARNGIMQMYPDAPMSVVASFSKGTTDDLMKVYRFAHHRRIQMLAVNHRRPLLQNYDIRRAMALAIDREKILKEVYATEIPDVPMRLARGPFPAQSWATPPKAQETESLTLLRPEISAKLQSDFSKRNGEIKFKLAFASDDPQAQEACSRIRQNIETNCGSVNGKPAIAIELVGKPSDDLRRDVEEIHDYDLAYYTWDYPDESFSLSMLLDGSATGRGERNFTGYLGNDTGALEPDRRLQQLVTEARQYRDVNGRLRTTMTDIHNLFNARMPFIPLWQPDRKMIVSKSLEVRFADRLNPLSPEFLDPAELFQQIESWRMN